MSTADGVFREFSAALQFPWYFGQNWSAFNDCLSDLSWINFTGLIVVIFDADRVLDEDQDDMKTLVHRLVNAHAVFSASVSLGEWWDRPPKPFHVLLQLDPSSSLRWNKALFDVRSDPRGIAFTDANAAIGILGAHESWQASS
jgi:hypothetical protein